MPRRSRQPRLLRNAEPSLLVAGEARRCGDRHIGRVAIDGVAGTGFVHQGFEVAEPELDALGALSENADLRLRHPGRLVAAEGDVELALAVVATQAVEGVAIEIDEQRGAAERR